MVDISIYQNTLKTDSIESLISSFQNSIIVTNRTAEFFVNWEKVRKNAEELRIELSLMNSLIGSEEIEKDFKELIINYPEALRTIPILLAVRDLKFPVIIDFFNVKKGVKTMDFNKTRRSTVSEKEIDGYLQFMKKSGLFVIFNSTKNLFDYVLGVEVGMDTNARKNRSGDAMEQLIKPVIEAASNEIGAKCLFQKKFKTVGLHGRFPASLANRKTDFIVYKGNKFVNIEVNYYSGAGSKPEEIVDSYINRKNELEANGWKFIWITDGNVWKGSESQLTKAFQNMDYIFNINFSNQGLLKEALKKILT
jgi:type II restriction enzyme